MEDRQEQRLQKVLAYAGIASRRASERMIIEGRVTVNGQIVTEMGCKVDPEQDHIKVDGKRIRWNPTFRYLLVNKPKGVVTTVQDPEGRTTIIDILPGIKERIYPIGRLDVNTEGVLLLTNDGELANQLTTPRSKCPKVYLVKVHGIPHQRDITRLERGVTIDGTRYGRCSIEVLSSKHNAWLKVTLTEGKNHHIKNIFASIARPVSKIRRVSFAGVVASELEVGQFRDLTADEVLALKKQHYQLPRGFRPELMLKDAGVILDRKKTPPSDKPGSYHKNKGRRRPENTSSRGHSGHQRKRSGGGGHRGKR